MGGAVVGEVVGTGGVVVVVADAADDVVGAGSAAATGLVVGVVDDVVVGGSATVRVVAHGLPAVQAGPPCNTAAVVSFAPPGAVLDTIAWKEEVIVEPCVAGVPVAGTSQVSVLLFVLSVRPCLVRSAGLVVTVALPSRSERLSTTVGLVVRTC